MLTIAPREMTSIFFNSHVGHRSFLGSQVPKLPKSTVKTTMATVTNKPENTKAPATKGEASYKIFSSVATRPGNWLKRCELKVNVYSDRKNK